MGFIVVDRIENGLAACEMEDRTMKLLPLSLLPEGTGEGDVLRVVGDGYAIDDMETARRREHNRELMRRLLDRGKEEPPAGL